MCAVAATVCVSTRVVLRVFRLAADVCALPLLNPPPPNHPDPILPLPETHLSVRGHTREEQRRSTGNSASDSGAEGGIPDQHQPWERSESGEKEVEAEVEEDLMVEVRSASVSSHVPSLTASPTPQNISVAVAVEGTAGRDHRRRPAPPERAPVQLPPLRRPPIHDVSSTHSRRLFAPPCRSLP